MYCMKNCYTVFSGVPQEFPTEVSHLKIPQEFFWYNCMDCFRNNFVENFRESFRNSLSNPLKEIKDSHFLPNFHSVTIPVYSLKSLPGIHWEIPPKYPSKILPGILWKKKSPLCNSTKGFFRKYSRHSSRSLKSWNL